MPDVPGEAARTTRFSRDVCAGVFLVLVGAFALWNVYDLQVSDASGVGPGMFPRAVALTLIALGIVIAAIGLAPDGDRLQRFYPRGLVFVLGAAVVFGATIRPLGLAVAGPAAVVVSALADRDSRLMEAIIVALVLTGLCIGLFKYLLRLPIPLAPFVLGY